MSGTVVWASDAMVNVRMLRPITHCFDDGSADGKEKYLRASRANRVGESLGPEFFPPEIFVARHARTNYESLPELFFAGSYWVVSSDVARIMRQFDVGNANLYETHVFRKDRKTSIGDVWFCLNFGNVKTAYLGGGVNHTPSIPEPPVWHRAPMILRDDAITLGADALTGPDIWVDPQIRDLFFLSDRLARALKDANLARAFGLKTCKVV